MSSGSYATFLLLPIPAYFLSNIVTNSDELDISRDKKAIFYYLSLIIILLLIKIIQII